VCALLAAAAGPIIRLVYGGVWSPAAAVLVWLALLAALRILFELVYDYFVVLANTRVVFTVQVGWLVALLPALYYGARTGGPAGAGAAAFAVAALVVAPIYLYELRRTGVPPTALAGQLLMPALAGVFVAVAALGADHFIPIDLLAVLAAGGAAAGALAVVTYRMRGVLAKLRTVGAASSATDLAPV
jgi:PST family polysaccharide transporter